MMRFATLFIILLELNNTTMYAIDINVQDSYVHECIMEDRDVDAAKLTYCSYAYLRIIERYVRVVNRDIVISADLVFRDSVGYSRLIEIIENEMSEKTLSDLIGLVSDFSDNCWASYFLAENYIVLGCQRDAKEILKNILEKNDRFYLAAEAQLYLLDRNFDFPQIVSLYLKYQGHFNNTDWNLFCADAFIEHNEYSNAEGILLEIKGENLDRDELFCVVQYDYYQKYGSVVEILSVYEPGQLSQTSLSYLAWSYYAIDFKDDALRCLELCYEKYFNDLAFRDLLTMLILSNDSNKMSFYLDSGSKDFSHTVSLFKAVTAIVSSKSQSGFDKTLWATTYNVQVSEIDLILSRLYLE